MRLDVTRWARLRAILRSRPLLFVVRLPVVILFLGLLYAAFFGSDQRNIATAGTGVLWMVAISVLVPVFGKVWCVVCPWDAIAEWCQRLSFWRKKEAMLTAGYEWPRQLANQCPALALFILLVWAEYAFHVTDQARQVGYVALGVLCAAMVMAFLFKRKTFCRYVCPVGAISGLYASFSLVEIRIKNSEVCLKCATKDCVRGNERGYGCPVYEYPGKMASSAHCILCTECIKTCPDANVALNLRPPLVEVLDGATGAAHQPIGNRRDLSFFVATMLALSFAHGMSFTKSFAAALWWTGETMRIEPWLALATLLVPFLAVSWLLCALVRRLFPGGSGTPLCGVKNHGQDAHATGSGTPLCGVKNHGQDAHATGSGRRADFLLLLLALFVHLIFLVNHVSAQTERLVPLLSDPLGRGWDMFGTANVTHFVPLEMAVARRMVIWVAVVGAVVSLCVTSVLARHTVSRNVWRAVSFAVAACFVVACLTAAVVLAVSSLRVVPLDLTEFAR